MKKLVAVALGMVAASALADLNITGDYLITTTQTISDKVTGTGRFVIANGATLKLSHSYNDFTGGIVVSNGYVTAEASGALGSGDVVFVSCPSTSPAYVDSDRYNRGVHLKAANGTFPNNFIVRDIDAHTDYPTIRAIYSATITGDISTPDNRKINLSADSGYALTVEGDITTPTLWDIATGRLVLKGKVTASTFQHGSSSSQNGTLELWNPGNEIRNFTMKMGSVECKAANVLYGTRIGWNVNTWWMSGNSSQIRMNGYDQAVGGIHCPFSDYYEGGKLISTAWENWQRVSQKAVGVITPDDKPTTLTIIGTAESWWPTGSARYFGPIDIVGNKPVSSYTCVPRTMWASHFGMTGTLATSNTTFYILNGASFTNAAAMVAASGGTFSLEAVTNAIVAAKTIDIAGTLYCTATCVAPINAPQATMNLAGNGVLRFLGSVTNTVKYLVVDGKVKHAGVYTKANLPQMNVGGKESDATAALVVLKGRKGLIAGVW